jgi:hypothetical protein
MEKQNERCTSGGGWKMNQTARQSSNQTSEIIAYPKVKRKFLS